MISNCSCSRWYALQVRLGYEDAVSLRLRDMGVEEFLPIHYSAEEVSRNRRRPPLFPGYVFCHLDLNTGPRLYSVAGVIRILGYAKRPAPIEDSEIEMVRRIVKSPLPVKSHPYLHPGDMIHLVDGPLAGVEGTVLKLGKKNQLVVSLPLLRRSLAVTVRSEWVALRRPAEVASLEHFEEKHSQLPVDSLVQLGTDYM